MNSNETTPRTTSQTDLSNQPRELSLEEMGQTQGGASIFHWLLGVNAYNGCDQRGNFI